VKDPRPLAVLARAILWEAPRAVRRAAGRHAFQVAREMAARFALELRPAVEAARARETVADVLEARDSALARLDMERARADLAVARAELAAANLNAITSFLSPHGQPERRA
jgi:hypothetical protein